MAGKGNQPAERPEGAVTPVSPFQRMLSEMAAIATLEETQSSEFERDDISVILEAATEEEMWDADELPSYNAKSLEGTNLQILRIEVKYGKDRDDDDEEITSRLVAPDGKRMFLLVFSVRINNAQKDKRYRLPKVGEEFAWNTSARYIVPKLWWMLKHGWFDPGHPPIYVQMAGKDIGKNRIVVRLKPLDGPPTIIVSAEENGENEPPF